jgi:hypothetical protein
MGTRDTPEQGRLDRAFSYAFDHFLRTRGWTVQLFSQVSQRRCPDNPIHPFMVTKWRSGTSYPSTESVLTTCRTFGVRRSFFYFVGEQLEELEKLGRVPSRRGLRIVMEAIPDFEDPTDDDLLRDVESWVVRQRTRLARLREEREGG